MLEQVKEYAMKKYAGDLEKVAAFVAGFEKEAATTQTRFNTPTGSVTTTATPFRDSLTDGVLGAVGKGIGGLAVGLGIHGLNTAMGHVQEGQLRTQFLSALASAISSNVVLRQANKAKVEQYAETIFKFAPHVSADPNLLSSILANAIHGEGIDPMTIKTLGDLEGRFLENRSGGGFTPKSYV